MGQKPVVSLEDRVPQLKQRRKKRANRRLLVVVLLFVLFILIILFFQSPYSKIQSISVNGLNGLTEEEIIEAGGVAIGDSFWSTGTDKVIEDIKDHLEVKNVFIDKKFPTSLIIKVEEYQHIAYVSQDQLFMPILENGASSTPVAVNELSSHAPILIGFSSQEILEKMATELAKLPVEVQQSISEVYSTPTDTDQNHINVYMNDGFEVSAVIDTFAEKMAYYPSIVSELNPDEKGIIDLEVGSYFKAYETNTE
ncbi:cell division protein FtsQ/DivIB [Jeotgalibacillus marinus]|uniref:Cell division protein DivIB n=1 Tax=Jeotgalibacillus marinus TaxID=86667 RepID=A0ABV3Q212_9BACL